MLSPDNKPNNLDQLSDDDFTLSHYRDLLRIALKKYDIASYTDQPLRENSLLWRHDVDLSLERSLALAKIEYEEGVKATYFVNPHSEFYNLSEKSQVDIVDEILSYGHDLGLHFDSAFYGNATDDLDGLVIQETSYLNQLFDKPAVAFSFHNPNKIDLLKEAYFYGGIVNCYSSFFKNSDYVSDANGYWRFERLEEFLQRDHNSCIQVCTHAGWWHESPLAPRIRVLRAAYERANRTMQFYDEDKIKHGRGNFNGNADLDLLIKKLPEKKQVLFDYLFCYESYQTVILELWRLHISQIKIIFFLYLLKNLNKTEEEANKLLSDKNFITSVFNISDNILKINWESISGAKSKNYEVINQMLLNIYSLDNYEKKFLLDKCFELCSIINNTADWGEKQSIKSNGL